VWWHLDADVAITSEWGTPSMIEHGLNPEDLLGRRFGHHLDFWSLSEGRLLQRIDLGDEHQMVLELRPAHHPKETWGFVGVVISVEDLSVDDRWLYVSCWGTGELKQFDVSDSHHPKETGSIRLARLQGGDASSDSYCFVE
jgi:selenium-binding protein 1